MAQHLAPDITETVEVVEAVTATGRVTYDLGDVIDGAAVEGVLRFRLCDGRHVDRPFCTRTIR